MTLASQSVSFMMAGDTSFLCSRSHDNSDINVAVLYAVHVFGIVEYDKFTFINLVEATPLYGAG